MSENKVVWEYFTGISKVERSFNFTIGEEMFVFYGRNGYEVGALTEGTTLKMVEALAENLGYGLVKQEAIDLLRECK